MGTFAVPALIDYGATFLWAVSGALVAARQGYDVVGIVVVALVSATGGGLLRDGLFLQDGPPLLVRTPVYLGLVLIGAALVIGLGRRMLRLGLLQELLAVVDAVGLGAYAVVGVQLALQRGLDPLGVVLVGVLTAVGGGVLRDVLMRREPEIFRPGTLVALAALAGCLLFLLATRVLRLPEGPSAWLTIGLVALLRGLSLALGWRTHAVLEDPPPAPPAPPG